MTLADLLRYIHLRLTQWLEEIKDREDAETVGNEHLNYLNNALQTLREALEYYQDYQLEEIYEEIGWAIADTQMGARFKGEAALKRISDLIDALERRDTTTSVE